jgi:prefoldin subunit 5
VPILPKKWATAEELEALAARIEANRKEQLEAVQNALEVILERISDVQEQIETQPKIDPAKAKEEPQSSGGFVPFSARKKNYERANRKELTTQK